ncbi:nascent polypeptide-associated complex subunit beta-like protein, partial [Tanacetum coccineum]
KKEVVHKTTVIDDKRLQSTVKRIGINGIPDIKEVNIFEDETVMRFLNPKAYTSPNQKLTLVAANDVSLKSEPTKDTHRRKPQAMNHYAAKYNYASAKRNNKEDEDDRRKEEAAFNICSSLSVRKSAVQTAGEY